MAVVEPELELQKWAGEQGKARTGQQRSPISEESKAVGPKLASVMSDVKGE